MLIKIKELLNNQEIQKQTQQVVTSINECLHILGSRVETKTLVAAYMLYKVRVSSKPFSMSYHEIQCGEPDIKADILSAIREYVDENSWDMLSKLLPKYAPDIFAATDFMHLTKPVRSELFTATE